MFAYDTAAEELKGTRNVGPGSEGGKDGAKVTTIGGAGVGLGLGSGAGAAGAGVGGVGMPKGLKRCSGGGYQCSSPAPQDQSSSASNEQEDSQRRVLAELSGE